MSMLRTLLLKDYSYCDNYGDTDNTEIVTVHLANSSWESDVLHIGLENSEQQVTMNFTLEQVKELNATINKFIECAETFRKERA